MPRSIPNPLSSSVIVRRAAARDSLLGDVIAAIDQGPIRERQIRDTERLIFGELDPADGTITLNIPLLRVTVAVHELIHRARPRWSERAVRAKTTRLLHSLDDAMIAELDARLVTAMRRRRATGSRTPRSANS